MENQLLDLNRESKVNEAQFFDQIKEAFHSKQLYENFLVCLALFNQDIITRPQLIALVEPSLSIFANLYKKFKDYVENRLLIVPTRDFELINENIYLCKREKDDVKSMVCNCGLAQQEKSPLEIAACGDSCINRLLMIECGQVCPCGDLCTNRNFMKKNYASIQLFSTELKGLGVKTKNDLKTGTFIIEFIGEVLDSTKFEQRSEEYAKLNNQQNYFMMLHKDLVIDATRKGNISRYFNHSCDPNCETQKWIVEDELRIGIFTRRPVSANQELTIDYRFHAPDKKRPECYCKSAKCRGLVGASQKSEGRVKSNSSINRKYCFCRKHIFASVMVACDNDQCTIKWFHLRCVGLQQAPKGNWFCSNCV